MSLVNEKVQHIKYGLGVVTEKKDNMIWVQFQNNEIGTKGFVYPESFEKFLKVENPTLSSDVLEELRMRNEKVEQERQEKERKVANLIEEMKSTAITKKKTTTRVPKKKKAI